MKEIYLAENNQLKMKKVDVMLGDGTITNAETFDPTEITNEFRRILQNLKDWTFTDISIYTNLRF